MECQVDNAEHVARPGEIMSNTMILKEGRPVHSLGSPGNVHCTVPQMISNVLDYRFDPYTAAELPRMLPMKDDFSIEIESYWSDVSTFRDPARVSQLVSGAPALNEATVASLSKHGIDTSPPSQLTKPYAQKLAPLLDGLFAPAPDNSLHHSNSIVVIDREGNIAATTHTINAVVWGDTGIVVDGIPIPDSAAFQQARLANGKPGERLPHEIIDAIVLSGDEPVLAAATIGASLVPESLRVLTGVLGQKQSLQTLMAEPALLSHIDAGRRRDRSENRTPECCRSAGRDSFQRIAVTVPRTSPLRTVGHETWLIERYSLTTCRMTFDVRLTEIVTFEEQRSIKRARQCVRKAVAEIEPSRMASFAKLLECPTGEVSLIFIDRHEGDLRFGDEQIEISNAVRAIAGLNDH
jgi:gamma-glutamyltranspeptidase